MTATCTVYRVGPVKTGVHSQALLEKWAPVDAAKPANHPVPRSEAIYTSPNLYGLERWLINAMHHQDSTDIEVHVIEVNPDDVYAYWVSHYDHLETVDDDQEFKEAVADFWGNGSTLSEWMNTIEPEAGDDAEVLLTPAHVLSSRQIHYPELIDMMVNHGMDQTSLGCLWRCANEFA